MRSSIWSGSDVPSWYYLDRFCSYKTKSLRATFNYYYHSNLSASGIADLFTISDRDHLRGLTSIIQAPVQSSQIAITMGRGSKRATGQRMLQPMMQPMMHPTQPMMGMQPMMQPMLSGMQPTMGMQPMMQPMMPQPVPKAPDRDPDDEDPDDDDEPDDEMGDGKMLSKSFKYLGGPERGISKHVKCLLLGRVVEELDPSGTSFLDCKDIDKLFYVLFKLRPDAKLVDLQICNAKFSKVVSLLKKARARVIKQKWRRPLRPR